MKTRDSSSKPIFPSIPGSQPRVRYAFVQLDRSVQEIGGTAGSQLRKPGNARRTRGLALDGAVAGAGAS
jgi:hypothetical protein